MQLALNVLIFVLGFGLAGIIQSRPKQVRRSLSSLVENVRHVLDGTKRGGSNVFEHTRRHSDTLEPVELLTRAQVEDKYADGTWQRDAYNGITEIVMGKGGLAKFPCVYATAGMRHNEHRWLFMPNLDFSGPRSIRMAAAALREYLPSSESIGPNTSLLVVFPPGDELSVASYQKGFWDFLRGLRTIDTKPWPEDIPSETASPKFTFCFDGIPAFLAAMTPAHEARASRHAPNFVIAVQPRWVFDKLFATPEKRRSAVDKVRNLMPAYDSIELSPDLSAYGQEGTTESHQFYLLDKNETALCPYEDMDG